MHTVLPECGRTTTSVEIVAKKLKRLAAAAKGLKMYEAIMSWRDTDASSLQEEQGSSLTRILCTGK
jgi:hypothetical protein